MNVFRESVRDKVLYNLVLFAVLLIGASYLIGQLTAGQDVKIIKDLGLSAMSVFGLFIAVFIGIGLVSKEVERRSIYSLLAKPVQRYHIVLGKYCGLVLTLVVHVSIRRQLEVRTEAVALSALCPPCLECSHFVKEPPRPIEGPVPIDNCFRLDLRQR